MSKTKPIKFNNKQNPNASFDIVDLQDILNYEGIDHSPFELHRVEFFAIIFIDKGEGIHTIDFSDYSYKKGTIITVRKDQIHKFHRNNDVKGSVLIFTNTFLVSYLDQLEVLKTLQIFNELISRPYIQLTKPNYEEISIQIERLREEYFLINDEFSKAVLRSELHILTTKLFRLKAKNNAYTYNHKYLNDFIRLQSLVEEQIKNTKKVSDYALMMHVSTKTLNNITNNVLHVNAKAFIDDICIKQIKRLLINTSFPIKEIAYSMGFEEVTNFYKYFKQQTGNTPEQFRTKTTNN